MNNTLAHQRLINETAVASWQYWVGAALSLALLAGAIMSTSSVAQLSYEAAQLNQQEKDLRSQKQLLQEKYASLTSLEATTAYAQGNGFTALAQAQATLDVISPLAQAH